AVKAEFLVGSAHGIVVVAVVVPCNASQMDDVYGPRRLSLQFLEKFQIVLDAGWIQLERTIAAPHELFPKPNETGRESKAVEVRSSTGTASLSIRKNQPVGVNVGPVADFAERRGALPGWNI